MECSDYVHLPGLTLPREPLRLALDLEERGFTLTPRGENLLVQPYELLTAEDCIAIRRWKQHLLALLALDVPEAS